MSSDIKDDREIRWSRLKDYPKVRFGHSTKLGGVSTSPYDMNISFNVGDMPAHVERNREIFYYKVGIDRRRVVTPLQCHSAKVVSVQRPGHVPSCDGLTTDTVDLFLAVTVADCLSIYLFDPDHNAAGILHAGWRGSRDRISHNAVQLMEKQYGSSPEHLLACIGPGAGVCCYEVGAEVASGFRPEVRDSRKSRIYLDLKQENALQLREAGLEQSNIEVNPLCTIHEQGFLHSYRRDGKKSGRMMGLIGIGA